MAGVSTATDLADPGAVELAGHGHPVARLDRETRDETGNPPQARRHRAPLIAAAAFLDTQGDVWDTQWDMFAALLGALIALGKPHDPQLARLSVKA